MTFNRLARGVRTAAFATAFVGLSALGQAQAQAPAAPSPAAIALAKEVLVAKGAADLLDPVIFGVVERTRQMFLRANPLIGKDLNEVAAAVRAEYAPRVEQLRMIFYRLYAEKFTEAELKELAAFYKSPLGQKVSKEEPAILEQAAKEADEYGQTFSGEVIDKVRTEMKKRGHEL